MTKPYQIGIDLGGTKTEVILFDPHGKERYRKRIATPRNQPKRYRNILKTVHSLIREAVGQIPGQAEHAIGIGIPGTINQQTRLVQNANTTCLIGRPFKHDLEKLLGRRIGMANDANCFTLAESRYGAARNYRMVFGIIIGTGCGGGLCIDGRIHQGQHGIAGEWGHVSVDPQGAQCYCGNQGCIETKISGTGVENAFSQAHHEHLKMQAIAEGYRKKDPRCNQVFEQFLNDFGRCLGGLISMLDPDAVVIGGGLSNIDELYTLGIERVRCFTFHQHITTPIMKNKLGDSAGVYGAAWIGEV